MRIDELDLSSARVIRKLASGPQEEYAGQRVTVNRIIRYLKDKGFRELGSGVGSTAYVMDNSKVIVKITWSRNDHQLKLYNFMKAHPNKHYPRMGKITDMGEGFFLVFMEHLEKKEIPDFIYSDNYLPGIYCKYIDLGYTNEEMIANTDKSHPFYIAMNNFITKYKSLCDALRDLKPIWGKIHDIHSNNIMFRGDGTPVIIDA